MNEVDHKPQGETDEARCKLEALIAATQNKLAESRTNLTRLRNALNALNGNSRESALSGMYRGVTAIDAIIVYLNLADCPVDEQEMINDLVLQGAGWEKAPSRGGLRAPSENP